MTRWRDELWAAGAASYDAILAHPFLAGLADGTLDHDAFRSYVVQDSVYLRGYARALALCAARATVAPEVAMFARHAADALAVEQALHTELLAALGVDPAEAAAAEPGPVTLAYTSYLLAVCATGSYAEAVAAVLPCYWIYAEVGAHLLARSSPDPRYARWIATYGAPEFAATVADVLDAADRLGSGLGPAERAAGARHFAVTARYEWMFWDAAHRRVGWPAGLAGNATTVG